MGLKTFWLLVHFEFSVIYLSGSVQKEMRISFHIFPPEHFISLTHTLDTRVQYSEKYINSCVFVYVFAFVYTVHVPGVFIQCETWQLIGTPS